VKSRSKLTAFSAALFLILLTHARASGAFPALAVHVDGWNDTAFTWTLPDAAATLFASSSRRPDSGSPSWPAGSALKVVKDNGSSVLLGWTAAMDAAVVTRYRIYVNGQLALTTGAAPLSALVKGLSVAHDYVFKIEAGDAAGNWSNEGPRAIRDTHPPVVSVTNVSDGLASRAASLSPRYTAIDDLLSTLVGTLDGQPFTSGTPVSAEGSHTLAVSAQDQGGHTTTVIVHFTLDRTPPSISLLGVADGARVNHSVTLTWAVHDRTATSVTALLDRAPFASGAVVSAEGSHRASVTAVDAAGNSATVTLSFVIQLSPRPVSILTPAAGAPLCRLQVDAPAAASYAGLVTSAFSWMR
jgi:hypothetical protein